MLLCVVVVTAALIVLRVKKGHFKVDQHHWVAVSLRRPALTGAATALVASLVHGQPGSIDGSFRPEISATIYGLAPTADGKLLLCGHPGGFGPGLFRRLNADGQVDATFNTGSGPSEVVYSMAVQPDGRILIGGNFTNYNGIPRSCI